MTGLLMDLMSERAPSPAARSISLADVGVARKLWFNGSRDNDRKILTIYFDGLIDQVSDIVLFSLFSNVLDLVWSLGALPDGLQAAAYAAYAGRGFTSYPSFGFHYPAAGGFPAGCGYFPSAAPGTPAITGVSPQTPTHADGFKATAYYDTGAVATPTLTPTAPITPTLTVRCQ
ncbi:hypothetical protein FHG87_008844 [Trinorchestia longiramus]|nr:hypothetical protein FHG87_008844 [Trinorchestia longiramus]